jgi:hypothetical protein
MAKKTKYTGGDCYMNAFDHVQLNNDWTLVHGIAIVTMGPNAGREFGHAWCEKGEEVYDAASGKTIPKVLYYAIGNVQYAKSYTWEEARKIALEKKVFGPWDDKVDSALHS